VAERLLADAPALAEALGPKLRGIDPVQTGRVLAEIGQSYLDYKVVAQREAEQLAELSEIPDVLVSIPFFETDIYDLGGLLRLGRGLWGQAPV
jgi:hypothetical protein